MRADRRCVPCGVRAIVIAGMLVFSGLLAGARSFAAESDADATIDLPYEAQSYRVGLEIVSDDDHRSTVVAERLQRELPAAVERIVGPLWNLETVRRRANDRPVADSEAEHGCDVWFRVAAADGRATVSAEEPLVGRTSPVVNVAPRDPRALPSLVIGAMQQLFRPLALWEPVDEEHVRVRLKGADIAPAEGPLQVARWPKIYAPHIVFRGRDGAIQRRTTLPWTLFLVDQLDAGRGVANVVSGLRNPVAVRPRGRVELLAVAETAQWSQTEIEFQARSMPPEALVAHDILVRSPEDAVLSERLTDRRGRTAIQASADVPWCWVTCRSGDLELATVPLVPGSAPTAVLDVPDDRVRLQVEGELRLLQGELVAVVAKRSALIVTARAAARREAWAEADEAVRAMEKLPSAERFRERVSGVRVTAQQDARKQHNATAERRAARLCDETEALIAKHLADDKIRLLKEELVELRAAAAEEAPAKRP